VNFIDELLRVVAKTQTIVKIFVVLCETFAADFDERALDTSEGGDRCLIVTMDQTVRKSTDPVD